MNELSPAQRVMHEVYNMQSGLENPAEWLHYQFSGGRTATGETMNHWKALGLPAVWSAVQMMAGHIGMIPIDLKKPKSEGGFESLNRHAALRVLNEVPNEIMTAHTFKESLMMHALIYGNGYAWIERNRYNRPLSLILIPPENVNIRMVEGQKMVDFWLDPNYMPPEVTGSTWYSIPHNDVFHLPGLSWNGIQGLSMIHILKNVLGIDLAGQDSTATTFRNNGRPG